METPSGTWRRKATSDSVIVFVHGLNSSSEECWGEGQHSWPSLVEQEQELKTAGIYTFSYETGVFSGSYTLGDAVEALRAYLDLDLPPSLRNLLFVCHSMGGIVVRQYLVTREAELREKRIASIGLFLVASPSLGSRYANLFSTLARALGHTQADALRITTTNAWLADLDRNFTNLKESGRLPLMGEELVEDKFIVLSTLLRSQVVPPFSGARYFANAIKIPGSNHFTIAKPSDRDSLQHRLLVKFALKCLCRHDGQGADTASSLRSLKYMHDLVHKMYVACDDIEAVLQIKGADVLRGNIRSNNLEILDCLEKLRAVSSEPHNRVFVDLSEIENTARAIDQALCASNDDALHDLVEDLREGVSGYLNLLTGQIQSTAHELDGAPNGAIHEYSGVPDQMALIQVLVRQHSCWHEIDGLCCSIRKILAAGGTDITADLRMVTAHMARPEVRQPHQPRQSLDAAYLALEGAVKSDDERRKRSAVQDFALEARDMFFLVDRKLGATLDEAVREIEAAPSRNTGVAA